MKVKFTDAPAAPAIRFARLLLYQATDAKVTELRLSVKGETPVVSFDGELRPAPDAQVCRAVIKEILGFAGVRLWPWRRSVSGRRLDCEFESTTAMSSWMMESQDIPNELILRRVE